MADNSKEIKSLIKLRQQRPAFSRMISWEISQCKNQQPAKKTKNKKKQALSASSNEEVDDAEDINSESAESSEYETANEDAETDSGPSSLTLSDSFNFDELCLITDDTVLEEDDDNDDVDDDELMMSCKSSNSVRSNSANEPQQERRRRPSKKQKKKRKKYFRMTYLDDMYSLGRLFDPEDNIDDVFTEVYEEGIDVDVKFRVPTLVELCLNASRKKRRSNSTKSKSSHNEPISNQQTDSTTGQLQLTMPVGLKKLLCGRHPAKYDTQNTISFFLNQVLPIMEETLTESGAYNTMKSLLPCDVEMRPAIRSVWNVLPYPWYQSGRKEMSTAFLFSSSMHRCLEADNNDYYYIYSYDVINPLWISGMCALANAIDLMLPSQICTTAIIRVKRALGLRYKRLVDKYFESVLPYVMWSRGLVSMATDMFKSLIENSKTITMKCMYLSEIAKMHVMFGDTKTAVQFYRLASDTASENAHGVDRDRILDEFSEQEQVLLASVYDTGVLDKDKAHQSNYCWSYLFGLHNTRIEAIVAGVDAYLCYHLYNWNDSKRYDEVVSKLEKIVKTQEVVAYYLAMMYALQGREDKSTRLYRQCRFGPHGAPADLIISYLDSKARNPWQPIIDLVNKQRSPISPLKVVWRTNLQAPRVSKHRAQEGDFTGHDLDLRLNEMGHLSGNMQMLLPPMRNISLDLFTGSVVVDKFSSTGVWTSAYFDPACYMSRKLMVPTPMVIYTGKDGTTVELMNPTNNMIHFRQFYTKVTNSPSCAVALHWRSSGGQFAKLNIFTEVKSRVKEIVRNYIKRNEEKFCTQPTNSLLKDEYELLFKILDKTADKNLALSTAGIDFAVRKIAQARRDREKMMQKGEKSAKSGKKQKKKQKKKTLSDYCGIDYSWEKYMNVQLKCEPFVFGSTVVLNLFIEGTKSCPGFFMFVNTKDKNSFLHYNLVEQNGRILYDCVRNNQSDEEFLLVSKDGTRCINIYNSTGCMVDEYTEKDLLGANPERYDLLVIGQFIYGITKGRNSIFKKRIGCDDEGFYVENFVHWSVESISDLWNELGNSSNNPPMLSSMTYIGKNFGDDVGKLLMLNLGVGLAFLDPDTMEFVSVNIPEIYSTHHEFTSNGCLMKGNFQTCKILTEKNFVAGNCFTTWTVISVQNRLFILETSHQAGEKTVGLSMIFSLILPGVAKEVGFIGKNVGLLISLSQHSDDDDRYREHVYQYDFDGKLHGVLLCLGAGPRSFFTQYFHDNGNNEAENMTNNQSLKGWHVYMKDGRDGILCVQLNQ